MATAKELRTKGKQLRPILTIGKNGLSKGTVELLSRELKQKGLIKIKLLEAARDGKDKKALAKEICLATKATLIEQVGHVIVLHKPK